MQQDNNNTTSHPAGYRDELSKVLSIENGQWKLSLAGRSLPDLLIKANEAVKNRRFDQANNILTEETVEFIRQLPQESPLGTVTMFMLAGLLHQIGQLDKAEKLYKEIVEYQYNTIVFNELASVCHALGHFTDAIEYRFKALEGDSHNATVLANYALDVIRAGRVQRGIDILRTAIEKEPYNKNIYSNYLWVIHYLPDFDMWKFADEHKKWAKIHVPVSIAKKLHGNNTDANRRLRIGYMSSNFCTGISAAGFHASLKERDREAIEVFGYCDDFLKGESTKHIEHNFDHFYSISGLPDHEVVRRIEEDEIDILVNFGGGHEVANRFTVMAFKPAPIQVDYGSINTTGIQQIDYRLTDNILDPPQMHRFYVEESVCLETGFFNFRPPDNSPSVGPLPARERGYVTFGSFNHNCKMNHHILKLWARILNDNENSRLVLKFHGGNDRGVQDYYLGILEKFGISRDRVRFYGVFPSYFEHLELYKEIDIVLDTYPFNGCMTTLECLWMGVPPISLVGQHSLLSRAGLSILTRIGLEIFAAMTPDEYVAKAHAFAGELDNLGQIRGALRQMMLNSNLCNPKKYAQSLEKAYRMMWHRWRSSHGMDVSDLATGLPINAIEPNDNRTPVSIADSSR